MPPTSAKVKPESTSTVHIICLTSSDSNDSNCDVKAEPKQKSRKRLFSADKGERPREMSPTQPTDKKRKTIEPTTSFSDPAVEEKLPSEEQIDGDLKIALERLNASDCKDSSILTTFENIVGEEGFSTLKNLFTAEASAEKTTRSVDCEVNEVDRLNGANKSQLVRNGASLEIESELSITTHPEIGMTAKQPQKLLESPAEVCDEKLPGEHTSNEIDLMEVEVGNEEADDLRCNPEWNDKAENVSDKLPVPSTDSLELECFSTKTASNEALKLATEYAEIVVKQEKNCDFADKVRAFMHENDGEIITIDDDECDVEKLMTTPGSPFSPIKKSEAATKTYSTKTNESFGQASDSRGGSPITISLQCSFIGCNFVTTSGESFQFHTLSKHVMMNVASPCQACNCSGFKCENPVNEHTSANVKPQVKEEKVDSADAPAILSVIKAATLAIPATNDALPLMITSPASEAQKIHDHSYMQQITPTVARPTAENQKPGSVSAIMSSQQEISMPVRPDAQSAIQQSRRLRPWLDDIDGKPSQSVTEMLTDSCFLNIFKCMGSSCHSHFIDSLQFVSHLFEHETARAGGNEVAHFSADVLTARSPRFTLLL